MENGEAASPSVTWANRRESRPIEIPGRRLYGRRGIWHVAQRLSEQPTEPPIYGEVYQMRRQHRHDKGATDKDSCSGIRVFPRSAFLTRSKFPAEVFPSRKPARFTGSGHHTFPEHPTERTGYGASSSASTPRFPRHELDEKMVGVKAAETLEDRGRTQLGVPLRPRDTARGTEWKPVER